MKPPCKEKISLISINSVENLMNKLPPVIIGEEKVSLLHSNGDLENPTTEELTPTTFVAKK